MSKIQDDDKLWRLAKIIVDHHLKRSFTRYHVTGKENIPKDGACVFSSNHCNTLMDALVLIASTWSKKVFIARGDIFKNHTIAKILRWMRILPIFRMRDGLNQVRDKNTDTIEQSIDVIHDEVPLFIFPEAAHRTKHSLRKLSKGIFHITLEANSRFGDEKPVYIVPVGLEYGDYFRFRSTVLVNYGKPINVTEYVKQHPEKNEVAVINELKDILSEKMSHLITYLPDDEDYDAMWEMTKMMVGNPAISLKARLLRNKRMVSKIVEFRDKEPEKAKSLFAKVLEFTKHRKQQSISVTSVAKRKPVWRTVWKTFLALLGLPFYLVAATASCPIWIISAFIRKNLKDKAFSNTATFCVELFLHPLIMATGVTLLFCLVPWEIAVIGSIFLYYSYMIYLDYGQYIRLLTSDWRWIFNSDLRKEFKELGLWNFIKRERLIERLKTKNRP